MPRHYLRGNRISCFCFLCQSNHWRSLKSIPAAFQNGPGGAGGGKTRGGGHQLRSAIVCLRKKEATRLPSTATAAPCPRPAPSSSPTSRTMGQFPKLAQPDCPRAGPPPTPSLFSADPGCRRTTWRGRDPLFNRRFVSSQQLLLFFFPSLSSGGFNLCAKGSPHPRLTACQALQDEGVGAMRAAPHPPLPKEQIHLHQGHQLPSRPRNEAGLPRWLGKPGGMAAGCRAHFRPLVHIPHPPAAAWELRATSLLPLIAGIGLRNRDGMR